MNKLIIAVLFTLVFNVNANADILGSDEYMTCGEELESNNGTFAFRFRNLGGNSQWQILEFYGQDEIQWISILDEEFDTGYGFHDNQWDNVEDYDNCFVIMQGDGNLVFYGDSSYNYPLWESSTHIYPGAYLNMQNDGNLVIYDANDQPVWSAR